MKATITIPTVQFGKIEWEAEGTAEEIVQLHNIMVAAYEAKKGEIQKLKDDNF